MKYHLVTFGCQQNHADSERISARYSARGLTETKNINEADYVIINTCMIRQSAENRVYGLVNNLSKLKIKNLKMKIIVTGCMIGLAFRDKTGKYLKKIQRVMSLVDEFLPIEEVGFDYEPLRKDKKSAWVPISNGCNNFCTYCVVPLTRGREVSRPYEDILNECRTLKENGYKNITLLGQNVNSYGADFIKDHKYELYLTTQNLKPIYVKHLGKYRIPTLFPYLLQDVAKMGFEKVDFISSNPWDFSDELIQIIAENENISRTIHLPVQSGDNNVLKRMNRWYTYDEYLNLVQKLKYKIKNLKLTTDIIVGFCGETEAEFKNTVKLAKAVGFEKAYIAKYSTRPATNATRLMKDDVLPAVKKRRWLVLENLINNLS